MNKIEYIFKLQQKMQCSICLGIPDQPKTMECCKNVFCKGCIQQWVQIRNVCPLCCAETTQKKTSGPKNINQKMFDDGSLIIETQMKLIIQRINFIQLRVSNRRQQFKNFKSSISASAMQYIDHQAQKVHQLRIYIEEQISANNRGAIIQQIQVLVELILSLQKALDNNRITMDNHRFQYQQNEQEGEQQSYYDEYDNYEVSFEKKSIWKGGKRQKISQNHKEKLKVDRRD